MTKTSDFGVLIGRFQPFHNGHLHLVREALNACGHLVVLVGSSNRPRLERNPFSFDERRGMMEAAVADAFGSAALDKLSVEPLPDRLYDYPAWLSEVQHVLIRKAGAHIAPQTALFGHHRDHTSFYLNDFPEWGNMLSAEAGSGNVEATHIRRAYFQPYDQAAMDHIATLAPGATVSFLRNFRGHAAFTRLMIDIKANADYKVKYGPGPHSAADPVVICSGRVLMIKRGGAPMEGFWALPGGFKERHQTFWDAAVAELMQETTIDLGCGFDPAKTEALLRSAYRGRDIFDDPHRSERANISTVGHLFDLGSGVPPAVIAADDAQKGSAAWRRISEIRADECFDDHAFLIKVLINRYASRQP